MAAEEQRLTVKLRRPAATRLQEWLVRSAGGDALQHADDESDRSTDLEPLLRILRDEHVPIRPVHPNVADPELSTYFTVSVPDSRRARRLAKRLLELPVVEAAYVKPADELP